MKSKSGKSYLYPEYLKRWRDANRVRLNSRQAARKRERRLENPEKAREIARKDRKKQLSRLEFRVGSNLRRRINKAVHGISKSARTLVLIGCSVEFLKEHLQASFRPGMTWENYGPVWHIDHIKPCAKFDLTDPEQQKLCFKWSNLQPLFALENIKKGDKYATPT